MRVRAHFIRLILVPRKGVVVVPSSSPWTGPRLGATRATSLQRVANRAIVCHVLDALHDAGVAEVAVLSPTDIAHEVCTLVDQEGPSALPILHVAYEPDERDRDVLLAAAEFVDGEECLLHRGDGLLGQPLMSLLEPRDADLDVLLLVRDDQRSARPSSARPLRVVPNGIPPSLELDVAQARGVFAGVCALGAEAMTRLAATAHAGAGLDFTTWATDLAREGASTEMRVASKWRHFTGDTLDLLAMNRAALDGLDAEPAGDAGAGNRFEGPIAIHPTATVSSSVIIGPVMIGPEVVVTDSYIGPHTSIGERVRIEGVEIERSIVLAGASVLHVSGRLVASVVGREARIFRDFSMPRALRLQVGDGDEVALC